jgi:regulator of sirC expression with transglutaminase-like and TPR domain
VNNNNQIRKIDLVIATMSSDAKTLIGNQGEIKSLSQTKKAIVDNTDKIAKENSISVKNRGDKKAGKSTLTYMMKQYRELGFDEAEQDYYDQNKAYGMKIVADISNKSILEQLQLDENDYTDMLKTQRELVQELQSKIEDVEEENRQLHVTIDQLNNGEE